MNFFENIVMNPSFLGSISGAVISGLIAIIIYKWGNKNEKKNQRHVLLSRKIYLLSLLKKDLERLKLSLDTWELQESMLNQLKKIESYFLLFDDKVLNQNESELLLLWQDLIIQIEYYLLFSASDPNTFDKIMKQMNDLLRETNELIGGARKRLKK